MQDTEWEVKLDKLKEFIHQCIALDRDRAEEYSDILYEVFTHAKRLFMFIFAEFPPAPCELQMPTERCWLQFIDPVQFSGYPSFSEDVKIHGLLVLQHTSETLVVASLLTVPSHKKDYSILIHSFNLSNILAEQQKFFNFIAQCTYLASTQSYMFKNFEKIYIGKREGHCNWVVHYAPRKIGLIGVDNYDVQYCEGSKITTANMLKFDKTRARVV